MSIEYIKDGFRTELASNLSNPVKVHEICLKLLSEVAKVLGINQVIESTEDGWIIINKLIEMSNEYVLARFYAENSSLATKLQVNELVLGMLIRDSITCMEKIRTIALGLTPREAG
ncbi:hypothetical protein [Caldivirga maquilingensis]|uniref:Uncharacterized protein n=1 Tax=Caldivirga maquilingensis (strain ATCC 700844 / DSM 13496 / JCM 10307 / IC-167) TaxID=397948 RepID=A8MCU1_CALMQ|nr:hypothetical protein [Caldivirga maquilingensis]ABW01597.1 hypothetical protein Cmaq_0761 [Caldivirga maquilingensis IC-167]